MGTYAISRYGFDYRITADDPIMEDRFAAGELCEQAMLDWIVANIPHGGIWVDAGANVGNHTLVFATACEAEMVIAFEPVPWNYRLLLENQNRLDNPLDNVLPLMLGVGLGPSLMTIKPTAQGRNCQFSLAIDGKPNAAVVSLDAVVPRDNVRLLKIDVEGMEYYTLRGAMNILEASHPEIFVEIWHQRELDMIIDLLTPYGYRLIECWNHSPTFHFSASGRYNVTYKPRQLS